MNVLITGSSGLIGSEAAGYFDRQGHLVVGVDNNMRREFFGAAGDTSWNLERLKQTTKRFRHFHLDVRDRAAIGELFRAQRFDLVVHCAAQPSHEKARDIPLVDFEVNALGTLNLLEATRQNCRDAAFVFMSSNKVYGDAPNEMPLLELEARYEYERLEKTAATGECYTVYGYKGKQVRDTIHSHDVVRAIEEFAASPRPGEVYNLGGGRENSLSVLEAITGAEEATGKKLRWEYAEQARKGDHICYISDTSKFQCDYPRWKITRKLPAILQEIAACYAREEDYVPIDMGNRGGETGARC
jgi:nucleoside-diphosphate-sugar epimerase